MDEWGTITRVNRQQGFLGAKAVGDLQIVELYPEMVRRLMAEDYSFLGGENEGFEAELVFSRPRGQLVSFTLREGCDGHVEIRTLIEKGGKQA